MKRLFLSVLTVGLITSAAFSQNTRLTREDLANFSRSGGLLRTTSATEYIGTPYFNEWAKGHVILNNNAKSEPIPLRYDMEYDAILFTRDDKQFTISNEKMAGFVIYASDGNIVFKNGFKTDEKDINSNTLLRIIYEGNTKLVAHHRSTLQENLPTYGTATKKSEFVNDTDYYLVTEDGSFHEIKLKKRDILDVLNSKKESVERYAESNNLDFDKESELTKILKYYDEQNTPQTK